MSNKKVAKTLVVAVLCSAVWCGAQIPVHAQETSAPVIGQTRERGKCTDTHSKDWCKAHGYGNNRPVGASLPLTPQQQRCVIKHYGSAAKALATGLFSMTPQGALVALGVAGWHVVSSISCVW